MKRQIKGLGHLAVVGLILPLFMGLGCGTAEGAEGFDGMRESEVMELREGGKVTGELEVHIEIEADSERNNASDPDDFETDIQVKVARNGEPVRDAEVTVYAYNGPKVNVRFDDVDNGYGEYDAEIRGYHRAYRVDVVAGDDRVEEIYLAGPAAHHFTSPEQNDRVPANQDLELRWEADDDGADGARIDGEGFDERDVEDSGSYTVQASDLGDDDDDDEDEFELKRWNEMDLTDLEGNSRFRIEVKNEVEVRLSR